MVRINQHAVKIYRQLVKKPRICGELQDVVQLDEKPRQLGRFTHRLLQRSFPEVYWHYNPNPVTAKYSSSYRRKNVILMRARRVTIEDTIESLLGSRETYNPQRGTWPLVDMTRSGLLSHSYWPRANDVMAPNSKFRLHEITRIANQPLTYLRHS